MGVHVHTSSLVCVVVLHMGHRGSQVINSEVMTIVQVLNHTFLHDQNLFTCGVHIRPNMQRSGGHSFLFTEVADNLIKSHLYAV